MNKRSFLYSAAFIGLMAASGASIPQAQAQKGMALQPSTQWAVNKVATESGESSYCAVARRFRPNTILTFARNATDEASFAIDFQSPKFRQAEGMEVILDPGAGQQRGFEVYPVSNQAFVIRLGRDDPFFSALDKTGYLRVEFGGKSYNFDLADIDVGQTKLATCLNDSIMPAAGEEDFPTTVSDNSNNDSVQRDIEELRLQLAKLKADNERLAMTEIEPADLETGNEDIGAVVSDQLMQQVSALEQENSELRIRLKGVKGGESDSLRSSKDVDAIAKLTKENQDLRTALETAQADDIQEAVLLDQVAELEEANRQLRNEVTQADASGVNSDDVLKVIQENEKLKEQLAHKSGDVTQTQELKSRISSLEQENQTLKATKAAAEGDTAAIEESRKQIEALKDENKRLQSVVKSSEVTGDAAFIVKELKGQVSKLTEEAAAKDKRLLELTKLSTEVQLLRTTNEELEKQLIESALRGPVNDKVLTQKIVALETQNDSLLQKIQSESDTVTEGDTQVIEALKAENEQLKKKIADNATLIETNKQLQEEVQKLRRENDELKTKASAAASVPGGDLAAQLQKAQDDNRTLQAQLQQKEAELAELPKLREEIERLRAENGQLKSGQKNPDIAASPGASNPEVETLHRENENLRQQIAGMAGKESEIADLRAKLQEQEAKIAAAEEAVKKAEADVKAAKDSAAKQTKEARAAQEAAEKKAAEELKKAEEAKAVEARAAEIRAAEMKAAEEAAARAPKTEEEARVATEEAEQRRLAKATEAAAPEGVAIKPQPLAPTLAIEEEMIRLEHQLSEAKASGDQMAIQQAARDYMNLKSKLSASQELAVSTPPAPAARPTGDDSAKALLEYAGTGKAPVDEVAAVSTMAEAAPASDPQSEALLNAGNEAQPTSNGAPEAMNDAQRQEQEMSVRASEDPYADMEVEDDFQGYKSVAGGSVKEQSATAQESLKPEGERALPEKQAGYSGRMNDSRMVTPDSVRDSYVKSHELLQQSQTPASTTTKASAEWAETTKGNVAISSGGGMYQPGVAVPQLLGSANVVSPQAVSVVSGASGADKLAYQWKANQVFGSAVQSPLSDPSRFDSEVQAYLEQTKKRCGQDFAVVPNEETQAGDKRVATYEIACVGQGVSSSASLIFFSQQGTFTVLAHEVPAEKLEDAMEIRDRLLKAIRGS